MLKTGAGIPGPAMLEMFLAGKARSPTDRSCNHMYRKVIRNFPVVKAE